MTVRILCCVALLGTACTQKQEPLLMTLQEGDHTGIVFRNDLTERKSNIVDYLYYYNGGGVAIGDINNDGLEDVYFTANEGANHLYLNKGNFEFENIAHAAGVEAVDDWSTGVTMVDINGDELLDVYVCQLGGYQNFSGRNKLFVNNGDLTFTDRAVEYGLDFSGLSTQAAFLDFDQDGDLDMFLLTHSVHSVRSYGSATLRSAYDEVNGDRLFRNDGPGKFVDVTIESGIYSSHIGYGLGVIVTDVNKDGWMDLYVSNDFHENDYLYVNQRNGHFREELEQRVGHTSRYSMGVDAADLNNDLMPDIFTVDMLPFDPEILLKSAWEDTQEVSDIKTSLGYGAQTVRNCLQINQGDYFSEIGQFAGVNATDWSWSPLMFDLDNDGIREIFVTNGIYRRPNDMDYIQYQASNVSQRLYSSDSARTRSLIDHMPTLKISNFLFVQEDSLQFVNRSESLGLSTASYSNGAAYGDLDNDGDLDLVVNNVNQEAFVYRNNARQQDTKLNFASFILKGDAPNTFAIGSSMVVYSGKRKLYFENNPVRGFLSSVSNRLVVGLADRAKIDSVDVVWNGTERETFSGISANSNNVLKKGKGRAYARTASSTLGWTWKVETVIRGDNHDTFSEFRREPLVPYSIAKESAAITSADVDGDGDADLFAGGSKYSPGRILIQDVKGDLTESRQPDLVADSLYEDTDAAFLDFNKDGRMDLYVASGGNDWFDGHQQLEDRLYVNDGKGRFYRNKQALPDVFRNSSCVRPTDFNNDGLVDLFVGVRSMPGQFGVGAKSYFLRNDGKGRFALAGDFDLGMVTDAAWGDHDRDGRADLFVASDWGNVLVLLNDGSGDFSDARKIQFGEGGLWRSLLLADLNGDGDTELLTGNWGENSRLQPTAERPISMIVGDFDNNGFWDPLLMESIADREIPLAPKNMLAKQMPFISKKFNSFRDYSKIRSVTDILSAEQMQTSLSLRVSNVASGWWKLSKKHSEWQPFPPGAQLSTINSMIPLDADLDGRLDIFCVGNSLMNSSLLGPLDAQSNVLLLNRGGKLVAYATATKDNFKTNYRKAIRWSSNRGVKIVAIDANGSLSIGQILIEPRRSD